MSCIDPSSTKVVALGHRGAAGANADAAPDTDLLSQTLALFISQMDPQTRLAAACKVVAYTRDLLVAPVSADAGRLLSAAIDGIEQSAD